MTNVKKVTEYLASILDYTTLLYFAVQTAFSGEKDFLIFIITFLLVITRLTAILLDVKEKL